MKNIYSSLHAFLLPGSFFLLLLTSCTKEAATKNSSVITDQSVSSKTVVPVSDAMSTAIEPTGFLGVYSVRDSKTIYIGQANPRGTNVFIHLDYIDVPKTILPAADNKHLTMPYGPSSYVDSDWAYLISYNKAMNVITLEPNAAMIADIVPGSFETLFTSFDPRRKEGNFVTRFTALSDKGNETEISEYFYK